MYMYIIGLWLWIFFAIFNNISVISCRSVLLVGRNRSTRRKPPTCRKSLTDYITYCIESTLSIAAFELTTLAVIDTDCKGICKCNYFFHRSSDRCGFGSDPKPDIDDQYHDSPHTRLALFPHVTIVALWLDLS